MPDGSREAMEVTLRDHVLWWIVALFLLGAVARTLIADEPLDWRKLAGEMILALVAAVAMWALGMMQGLSPAQMLFFGAVGGLGGVRLVEWLLKIARAARREVG